TSLPEREDVPSARSSFSQRTTDKPRPAASRANPAPLIPPPIMSRSWISGSAISCSFGCRILRRCQVNSGQPISGKSVPDGRQCLSGLFIGRKQFCISASSFWVWGFRRSKKRCNPFIYTSFHVSIGTDCNRCHHGGTGSACFFTRRNPHRRIERGAQRAAQSP